MSDYKVINLIVSYNLGPTAVRPAVHYNVKINCETHKSSQLCEKLEEDKCLSDQKKKPNSC